MRTVGPEEIDECVDAVDAGRIVVVPTRRWYMLCADSTVESACEWLFRGKGRPVDKPLALVPPTDGDLAARCVVSPAAWRLVAALWPGDLGLLLPWAAGPGSGRWWLGADAVLATRDAGVLGALGARARNPPATTVVSRSTANDPARRAPALTVAEVERFVEHTGTPVDLVVDGGVCPLGRGLTVVDCVSTPRIVRQGAVHSRAIEAALGGPTQDAKL